MQSSHRQLKSKDDLNRNEQDTSPAVPDFARAWESLSQVASPVRRPSTLPDPNSYHEEVVPEAIFELDEKQKDGSIKTILVTSFGCERCRTIRQACSRAQPTCRRCENAKQSCRVAQGRYQRLPGPKIAKSSAGKQNTSKHREGSEVSASVPHGPATDWLRDGRRASNVTSLSQGPLSGSRPMLASGSKRPLSPGSDPVPSRKKIQAKTVPRDGKRGCRTTTTSNPMVVDCSEAQALDLSRQPASAVTSSEKRGALKWVFVNNSRGRDKISGRAQEYPRAVPSDASIPRVWTNSLDGLLTVFPELAQSPVGLSWLQSEVPILLLDSNDDQSRWINSTTLTVDLPWDFSCYDFELELIAKSSSGSSMQLHSCQPMADSTESTLNDEAETMGLRHPSLPPGTRVWPTCATASSSLPTSSTRMLSMENALQHEPNVCDSHNGRSSLIHTATPNGSASAGHLTEPYPSDLHSPSVIPLPSHPLPSCSGVFAQHSKSQADFQPRIPVNKPPEIEALSNSHLRCIPLLLWMPHDSKLVPSNLPSEYAYLCMGLFFVSNLHHVVIQYDVSSTTGIAQGRVYWSVTLQWAPGGEDGLFDCRPASLSDMTLHSTPPLDSTRDVLHPWWTCPVDALSPADATNSYRPRDLRMQFFSFIPLDLLADFHPSEVFPRAWFCKLCGMINIQEFFRHQICQSNSCRSMHEKHVFHGKVGPLSSFRGPYQTSTLIQPKNSIPSAVASRRITWDDGMHSWIHSVKEGVTLCHVFTGNQEHLQEEATSLFERIQREVLLRKEDPLSPYFVHTTSLSHPSDGSEPMVPVGTSDCIRIAYHTLSDFVLRYGEMDKPRFGEVRMQAWVNSGSRKGNIFHANRSPVVIHCLGAEVVLKFTPRGGYAAELTTPDKGKERAGQQGCTRSPSIEPHTGPSCDLDQNSGDNALFIPGPKVNDPPIVVGNLDKGTASRNTTVSLCFGSDVGGDAMSNSNASHVCPRMEVAHHKLAGMKQRRVCKENKVTKPKHRSSIPVISMTLVHGDCVILYGDDFECRVVRTGTTILVIGFPEEA